MQISVEQLILPLVLLTPVILGVNITAQPAPGERQRGAVSVADNDLLVVLFRKPMEANGGERSDAPPRGHRAADEAPGVGERSEQFLRKKQKFASSSSPTSGIQEAIDALGENGGIVTIPPGEYLLRRSIRVRSNVTLQGAGEETVLRKVAQLGSKLAAPADAESRSVRVQDATGFREGDEIGLFDQTTVGWLHVHFLFFASKR